MPCHLSSFQRCSGYLIFLWEQLVYSVVENKNKNLGLYHSLINVCNVKILISSPKLHIAPLTNEIQVHTKKRQERPETGRGKAKHDTWRRELQDKTGHNETKNPKRDTSIIMIRKSGHKHVKWIWYDTSIDTYECWHVGGLQKTWAVNILSWRLGWMQSRTGESSENHHRLLPLLIWLFYSANPCYC